MTNTYSISIITIIALLIFTFLAIIINKNKAITEAEEEMIFLFGLVSDIQTLIEINTLLLNAHTKQPHEERDKVKASRLATNFTIYLAQKNRKINLFLYKKIAFSDIAKKIEARYDPELVSRTYATYSKLNSLRMTTPITSGVFHKTHNHQLVDSVSDAIYIYDKKYESLFNAKSIKTTNAVLTPLGEVRTKLLSTHAMHYLDCVSNRDSTIMVEYFDLKIDINYFDKINFDEIRTMLLSDIKVLIDTVNNTLMEKRSRLRLTNIDSVGKTLTVRGGIYQ